MSLWFWLYASPWIVFVTWWLLRALSTAKTVSIESVGSRMSYRLSMAAAILILWLSARYDLGFLSRCPVGSLAARGNPGRDLQLRRDRLRGLGA